MDTQSIISQKRFNFSDVKDLIKHNNDDIITILISMLANLGSHLTRKGYILNIRKNEALHISELIKLFDNAKNIEEIVEIIFRQDFDSIIQSKYINIKDMYNIKYPEFKFCNTTVKLCEDHSFDFCYYHCCEGIYDNIKNYLCQKYSCNVITKIDNIINNFRNIVHKDDLDIIEKYVIDHEGITENEAADELYCDKEDKYISIRYMYLYLYLLYVENIKNKRKEETSETQEKILCAICKNEIPNIVYIDCKHLCICKNCFDKSENHKCPICGCKVTNILEISYC